jgi:hypothetical protein
MNDYFTTRSGRHIRVLDPKPDDIFVPDIAWALSRICRFGGHSPCHDSVAQHSVIVSQILEDKEVGPGVGALPLLGLLHDAAEAYVGDVIGPLKHALPDLMAIEDRWLQAIGARVLGDGRALIDMPPQVKLADHEAFHMEWETLFVGQYARQPLLCCPRALMPGKAIWMLSAEGSYDAFERRYVQLTGRSMYA